MIILLYKFVTDEKKTNNAKIKRSLCMKNDCKSISIFFTFFCFQSIQNRIEMRFFYFFEQKQGEKLKINIVENIAFP